EPVLIAVLLTDQNRPAAVVNAFANGSAELIPLESIPVPPGRALEIWTIPEANGRPISVGVLDTVRSMQLNLGQAPGLRQSHVLAISIEPSGGSPTGQPTGPVIMKGTAAAAL
ncbi:MAG TPA: anti-sigma factor, partial [Microvirga sp.]